MIPQEQVQIDITDNPGMREIAEAVRQTGRPCLLTESGEAVALVMPLDHQDAPARRRRRRSGVLRPDDPLFQLIGIGEGKTPGGVSGKKHEALAQAYRPNNPEP